jgi:hypothetical protein
MKIAKIAPLIESVPPRLYGGTERVVSYLTEELVTQGHEVTLFASGDSITAANLVPCCTRALRLVTAVSDVVPYYMLMLDKVRSHAADMQDVCRNKMASRALIIIWHIEALVLRSLNR